MKPIYISQIHEVIIETYLDTVYSSISELNVGESKYNDFVDIANVIIQYHNSYSENNQKGNYNDFLMIIPMSFSTMVSGFLCGLEEKENRSIVKIHRHLLYEFSLRAIEDLKKIEPIHE